MRHSDAVAAIRQLIEGPNRALLTDSGTSALALALAAAAEARQGLAVALPAYSCYDLATAALAARVRVRFYDVDPRTLGPDDDSLRSAIAAGVSGVLLVHPYGIPQDTAAVSGLARAAGALLIEDLAQADGALIRGEPLGGTADYTVRSFGRGKGWTGGGGGALLVAPDAPQVALPAPDRWSAGRLARFVTTIMAQWIFGRPGLYVIPASLPTLGLGETRFKDPSPPRTMHAAQARIAAATAPLLAAEREHRRGVANFYGGIDLEVLGWSRPTVRAEADCGWLRYPVIGPLPEGDAWKSLGIARGYPTALPHLVQLSQITLGRSAAPGAEELARSLWTLPTHRYVTERWRSRIARWLSDHAPSRLT